MKRLLLASLLCLAVSVCALVGLVNGSSQQVLATGTATLANTKLSLADSYAFFDMNVDLSAYIGESIKICNTSNKALCIEGVIGTAGTGETLGDERLSSWANSGSGPFDTLTLSGTDIDSAIDLPGGNDKHCIGNALTITAGGLYKHVLNITLNSGTIPIYMFGSYGSNYLGSQVNNTISVGVNTVYFVRGIGINGVSFTSLSGNVSNFSVASNSIKQVTAPSATGFWIKQKPGAADGGAWGYKNASFDPNQASGFTYQILSSNVPGKLTASGSLTASNVRLATVDGGAMVEISGTDLSAYAGSDAYTPLAANLVLHLKADTGCYTDAGKTTPCASDGDKAYTWADQSGSGNDAVQATEGNRPLYKTNIVGSLPAIRFDGSNDYFSLSTTNFPSGSNARTIYAVIDATSILSGASILSYGTNSANLAWSLLYGGASPYQISANSYLRASAAYQNASTDKQLVSNTYTADVSSYYINGFSSGNISHIFVNTTLNTGELGHTQWSAVGAADSHFAGDIYEILIYDSQHTEAERIQTERYLAGKWGITYTPTIGGVPPAKYLLVLEDSSGRVATGYIGAVGAGEALDGELVNTSDFSAAGDWLTESGWAVSGGAGVATSATINFSIYQLNKLSGVAAGNLVKMVTKVTAHTSGGVYSVLNGADACTAVTSTTTSSCYRTKSGSNNNVVYAASANGTSLSIDDASYKKVTEVGATGVHLHSTPNGTDRKMARKESGFDANAVTKYRIYRVY